jgi:hypothetical protein
LPKDPPAHTSVRRVALPSFTTTVQPELNL